MRGKACGMHWREIIRKNGLLVDSQFYGHDNDQGVADINTTVLSSNEVFSRSIGVNYNQVVKELDSNFGEKKHWHCSTKWRKQLLRLVAIKSKIIKQ